MNYKKMFMLMFCMTAFSSFCLSAEELFTTNAAFSISSEMASDSLAEANELVANKMNIKNHYIYNINAQALSSRSLKLSMNLTPNLILDVNRISETQSATGSAVWKGRTNSSSSQTSLRSDDALLDDSVIMVIRDGKITATVRTEGRLFKIQPLFSGQHIVLEINEDYMEPDHPEGAMEELESQIQSQIQSQMQLQVADPAFQSNSRQAGVNPVIRTLVVYTATAAKEVADMASLVDLAIAETNQGFINSGVYASVELAHLQRLTYRGVSISRDLTRIKSKTDGHMDEVHALRDKYNADVVMLIVADQSGGCGKAGAIGAIESTAFAVTAQDCATGYYSFGHELGHLLSARHDPSTDGSTRPYRFGHGYWDPAGKWRTVMAYRCGSGCTRINWWSNPNNARNGTKMGTAARSDNARVLNITSSIVANFRGNHTGPARETLEYFVTEDLYVGNLGRFKNVTNVFVDGLHKGEETRGLLKFDVNAFNSPGDKKVKSVKIRLGINNTSKGSYAFYVSSSFWSEKSADWSSAALTGQQLGTIFPSRRGAQTFMLNAKAVALVQGWIDGSIVNNGFVLASLGTTDGVRFYAKNHATGVSSSLVIEYQ